MEKNEKIKICYSYQENETQNKKVSQMRVKLIVILHCLAPDLVSSIGLNHV
jgi:hypothetical protein